MLQISPEEQRRAARTAALFSEEELTRFLQMMLRTFDELGYRQEQRFHFELGLLKLVHLRRLLPIEEVLSAMDGTRATAPTGATGTARNMPGPVSVPRPVAAPAAPLKPAFSPFEQDKNRRKYDGIQGGVEATAPPVSLPVPVAAAALVAPPPMRAVVNAAPVPAPASIPVPDPVKVAGPIAVAAPGVDLEVVVKSSAETTGDTAAIQKAVVEALQVAGQGSAADAMGDSVWTAANGEARVQTEMSKTMLPARMNPDAEKIAKLALRPFGITRLVLLPGAASSSAASKMPRAAKSGSAEAKALAHPLVQKGRELFEAEIQTVIDLNGTD